MKRDEQVNIRLTEFEYWRAHDACAFLDVTMSQVCRRALRQVAQEAASKGWNPEVPIDLQAIK
jgi:antitoxin component of RelBE/YafQ-DinJ toxin-antitoxin module